MNIKKKDAVTALELLVVIVIVGILAAIAMPVYTNKVERTYGQRAKANIQLIANALRKYYYRNNRVETGNIGNLATINSTFGLELSDPYFDYEIHDYSLADPQPGDPNPVFPVSIVDIQATRKSGGRYGSKIISYSYNFGSGVEGWTDNDNQWPL
jgi:prepilin-type N-terminal cleavage/methylation domain-containing protein